MVPEDAHREQGIPPRRNGFHYAEDGVDVTLIRWMLSLTPTERLQVLQQNIQSLRRLIDAIEFI